MGQLVLGSGNSSSEPHTVKGILVRPSAGNWVVTLKDSAGNTLFDASGVAAESFYVPVTISADAFNQTTSTNIETLILYL